MVIDETLPDGGRLVVDTDSKYGVEFTVTDPDGKVTGSGQVWLGVMQTDGDLTMTAYCRIIEIAGATRHRIPVREHRA